ncbi:hypothetical protein CLE01_34280 [Cryobacterium levicorallinum]|uniref:Uncharacterized protein n=1 Tax=Cryobacterium levicorallinum TaxID=995038 RepID=A0ABY1EIM3_9MICO|nr:hypothetical protein CLE01_34280 [Cryobacterium levicorallinum]SFI00153.1 hypothetical protein SAMN05216274_1296 [Cryobacterium levicorallinum]
MQYPLNETFPRVYRLDLDDSLAIPHAFELIRMAAKAPVVVSFYTHWTDQ